MFFPKILYFLVPIMVLLLVYWHNATYDYICASCNNKFSISYIKNLISPHFFRKKYLRCPVCKEYKWCLMVKK